MTFSQLFVVEDGILMNAQGTESKFESSGLKIKDMDVTLSCDTVFGVLDAARKYMVEEIDLIDYSLISWLN